MPPLLVVLNCKIVILENVVTIFILYYIHCGLCIYCSGQPNAPQIESDVESIYSDQFNLTWSVESFAEITSYRIIYRKYLVSTLFQILSLQFTLKY